MEAACCYGDDWICPYQFISGVQWSSWGDGLHSCFYCLETSLFVADQVLVSNMLDSAVLATQAVVAQQSMLATVLNGLDDQASWNMKLLCGRGFLGAGPASSRTVLMSYSLGTCSPLRQNVQAAGDVPALAC